MRTTAYHHELLQPLLEVAIASATPEAGRNLGLLLVACDDPGLGAVSRLAQHARTVFANRPLVRFGQTELAILLAATDEASARVEAADLIALAQTAGLEVWCGYAALNPEWGAIELIAAAEAALATARRVGPTTIIG